MSEITTLRTLLEQRKGQKFQVEKQLEEARVLLLQNKRALRQHEQAREIIKEAGLRTQQSLAFHISEITSLALDSVFDDPYGLCVEFVERRNKTECDLYFSRDGNRIDPMEASGGGAVDVAAFALRIASYSMTHPRFRPTILLDEPFNRLKGEEANLRVLNMIKEISKKLGVQIIIVSDERISRDAIIENADRTFLVSLSKRKRANVTVIEKQDEPEYRS